MRDPKDVERDRWWHSKQYWLFVSASAATLFAGSNVDAGRIATAIAFGLVALMSIATASFIALDRQR